MADKLEAKDKEIQVLLDRLKIQKVKSIRREESPVKKKTMLFSTKEKTLITNSKRSSLQHRDRASLGSGQRRLSNRQSRSFVIGHQEISESRFECNIQDRQYKSIDRKDESNQHQFFLSPEAKQNPKQEQKPFSNSFKDEPSDRLKKARLLSQRCRSFLGDKKSPKEEKEQTELIPAGLREYLHRLKSAPIVNRASSVEEAESFIIKKRKNNVIEEHYVEFRSSSTKRDRPSNKKERKLSQEERDKAKYNCNKKLSCARRLTFDESFAPPTKSKDDPTSTNLIVSLSEELLKKRAALKSKAPKNLSKNHSQNYNQDASRLPLSASTNNANANCFIMGISNKTAARKPTSVDLKEQHLRKLEMSKNDGRSFLQESLRQASNPFRVLCSPLKHAPLSYR